MAANEGTGDALRFRNGLPTEATTEDKKAFAVHCARNYQAQNWKGNSLSEYFADDFHGYSIEYFTSIDSDTHRNLTDLLRQRGVYVPKGRNILIAQALHQIVQEEISWPDNDPEKPIELPNITPPNDQGQSSRKGRNIPQAPVQEIAGNGEQHDGCTTEKDTNKNNPDNNRPPRRGNMENLFKAYSNAEDKYSGSPTDNFERKYMLFLERCDQADIPDEDRHRAFSIMLIDSARQYYFDSVKSENLDLKSLEKAFKNRFQTPERTRALLREWELLTLNGIINSNTSKTPSDCLEILMKKLSDIQTSLLNEYRNETILRKKLLNAVRDVESCRLVYHKPADTIQGVISDIHATLATMKTSNNTQSEPSAHLVDRRYVKNGDDKKRGGPSRQKKCFVCKRPGCWSTNHSSKERLKAYRNSKVLRQFVTSLSPDEKSDDEERETADNLEDVIAHIVEIGQDEKNENRHDPEESFSHIATIDDEDTSVSFTAQLNDSIVTHALTLKVTKSRFGNNFEGVMVETSVARGSSAGKAQYEAYCAAAGKDIHIDQTRAARCHFGIGSSISLGIASFSFPMGSLWLSFDAHIVDADNLVLLSIDDMDRLGIYLNNLEDVLVHSKSGLKAPITRVGGHPFVQWNPFI